MVMKALAQEHFFAWNSANASQPKGCDNRFLLARARMTFVNQYTALCQQYRIRGSAINMQQRTPFLTYARKNIEFRFST